MYKVLGLSLGLFILSSCGGFKIFGWKDTSDKDREVAGQAVQRLFSEEESNLSQEIDDKLMALQSYSLIAQKLLYQFDQKSLDVSLQELYQSPAYLNLLAVKSQTDEIEDELVELHHYFMNQKAHLKDRLLSNKINALINDGPFSRIAVENLNYKISGVSSTPTPNLSLEMIENYYQAFRVNRDFQVYEKNIEHIGYMMEISLKDSRKEIKPSLAENGNISGEAFPASVWSITINDGPGPLTEAFQRELVKRKLKATFFQIGSRFSHFEKTANKLIESGMEIGTQSHSNRELSKVGSLTLEKEITEAKLELQKNLKTNIMFARLPYGSGATVPSVRELLTKNNLIHVTWNVDTLDWTAQSPDRIITRTKRLMMKTKSNAGIILFHDTHPRSLKASSAIMDELLKGDRRVCTLSKIVKDMNEGKGKVCSKKSF